MLRSLLVYVTFCRTTASVYSLAPFTDVGHISIVLDRERLLREQ